MLRARARASKSAPKKASNKIANKPTYKASAKKAAKAASGATARLRMRLCSLPPRTIPPLAAAVMSDPIRASAIVISTSKWLNGTVLHYCFFKSGHWRVPKRQAKVIRAAFAAWKAIGIGLQFKEVDELREAEVRIGYSVKDGSSESAVGPDVLNVPLTRPTTVYGWDLTKKDGRSTALHEIGHVLGMEHEHQNPFAGIKWHEDAVYKSLMGKPNEWTRSETFHNILEKLSPEQTQGSKWDPASIMEYEFEAGLIAEPKRYETEDLSPPGTLSAADKKWMRKWYPPLKKSPDRLHAHRPAVVELASGKQINFLIEPVSSRKYRIETNGASDTKLALFEVIEGTPRYVAADNDSGKERNAAIVHKLFKGRQYIVRLRMVHPGPTGEVSLSYA